jgi:hypothetical protein
LLLNKFLNNNYEVVFAVCSPARQSCNATPKALGTTFTHQASSELWQEMIQTKKYAKQIGVFL